MLLDISNVKRNSIIELCVVPDVKVHCIMKEMSESFDLSYFIDTVGNLKYIVKDAIETYSIRKFIRELKKLKNYKNFSLFIDSITIVGDKRDGFTTVMSILMELINFNKATIILSNHYSYLKGNTQSHFVPRMGLQFGSMIHYRILFQYKRNKLVYEIVDNQIETKEKISSDIK